MEIKPSERLWNMYAYISIITIFWSYPTLSSDSPFWLACRDGPIWPIGIIIFWCRWDPLLIYRWIDNDNYISYNRIVHTVLGISTRFFNWMYIVSVPTMQNGHVMSIFCVMFTGDFIFDVTISIGELSFLLVSAIIWSQWVSHDDCDALNKCK